ncbi:hypothetical protein [Micromonospora zamorensis]|uniref:hypothetical protein n=1 Tax=Micromonospora zamorensis TaxID=709883 RepID=UPI0033ACF501
MPVGPTIVGALTSAILLFTTGCSGQSDTPAPAAATQSSAPAAAMRIDKPAKLLGTWTESVDRGFHDRAEQQMGTFKKLLTAGPTSAGVISTPSAW